MAPQKPNSGKIKMIIRPYTEKDFQGILRVIQATQVTDCWPKVFPNGWSEERIREEFDPLKEYKNSIFLVFEEGEITGFIAGHDLTPFIQHEIPHLAERLNCHIPAFYQRDIIITPKNQRGTLGIRLFRAMSDNAKRIGYTRLITRTPPLNIRGTRFFKKLGYEEIFRDDNPLRIYFSMEI